MLHTCVIAAYGLGGYALFAWVAGAFGLCFALAPDPHSYLLVRAHGARATRLARLVTPYMYGKTVLVVGLTTLASYALLSDPMRLEAGARMWPLVGAALLYGAVEALWSYTGIVALAAENLRPVAIAGVLARTGGLLLAGGTYLLGGDHPLLLSLMYATPLYGVMAYNTPVAWRPRATATVTHHAIRRYALWSQGIGLTSNWLSQLVPLVAGGISQISPANLGALTYATRLLLAVITPLQVFQSVIIKEIAKHGSAQVPSVRRYDLWFKRATLALVAGCTACILASVHQGLLSGELALTFAIQATGLLIFCWYRVPLTRCMARQARALFVWGYAPAGVLVALLAWPLANHGGLLALTLLNTAAWLYIALSWRLPPLK